MRKDREKTEGRFWVVALPGKKRQYLKVDPDAEWGPRCLPRPSLLEASLFLSKKEAEEETRTWGEPRLFVNVLVKKIITVQEVPELFDSIMAEIQGKALD